MRFLLFKDGSGDSLNYTDPGGSTAQFPITSAGREHGGSYTCRYSDGSGISSEPSDPVQVIVSEPSDPKPSVSLSPSGGVSLGASVTIQCRGPHWGRRFVLKKEGHYLLHKDSDGFEAEFPLSSLRREQGGSYSCSYHRRSEPFTVSYPSDPVELVLRDPSLPRPSISLSPTGVTPPGANVTVRCQGPGWDVRFFLHQAGDLNQPQPMEPAGDGAEFHIRPVGRQHGGSYSCSYRPRAEPFVSSAPSDPVELVVAGEGPGSMSLLPAPLPAGPWQGICIDGTVRARLCPGPSRGVARPGSMDGVTGVPSPWAAAATGDAGQREVPPHPEGELQS
ncbi:immunoglobulin superfamily member 1-like [Pelodiscus sinensis]|uniref:immunoglobulin superfamily member 1-like n=1 Tax=Pelodiscus sinensis TaxID=13735 RepID=UPI003F6AF804